MMSHCITKPANFSALYRLRYALASIQSLAEFRYGHSSLEYGQLFDGFQLAR